MKLLSVTPLYWPAVHLGGLAVSVNSLNKALAKKGVNVTVYTSNTGLNGKTPVNQEINFDGINVTYFRASYLFDFVGDTGWQFSGEMTKAIKRTIKNFDIVHINGIWSYPAAVTAHYCRKYEKPYVISPHGMLFAYTLARKAWKKWPYYTALTKRDLRNASALHFLTDSEKSKVHQSISIGTRSFIVPVGVETSEFDQLSSEDNLRDRYPQLKDKKIILFFGRISWKKGLDILVAAFNKLVKSRKDVHLLIAGPDEGGYSKKIKKLIEDNGISEHVTFTGALMGKEKAEAFKKSDIFVLPSYSEALSTSMLEAMYCGLPVIVSDQSDFPEIIQYNAGKVIPCDNNFLARAMEELIDDKEQRIRMGENGRRLVIEKFTWDNITEEMIKNYRRIIQEHRKQLS
jgi:glycosyltransferase involved in cell wall biosynthesis